MATWYARGIKAPAAFKTAIRLPAERGPACDESLTLSSRGLAVRRRKAPPGREKTFVRQTIARGFAQSRENSLADILPAMGRFHYEKDRLHA